MTRRRVTVRLAKHSPALNTRQEPKADCDVNNIVAAARRGIQPAWLNRRPPVYADISEVPKDLTQAYLKIEAAEAAFMSLPSEIRSRIDNDPRRLESWLRDPQNRADAVKYGVMEAPPKEEPIVEPEPPQAVSRRSKEPKATSAQED